MSNKCHPHYDVILAYAEGKQIEFYDEDCTGEWVTLSNPNFFEDHKYRVKSEKVFPRSSLTLDECQRIYNDDSGSTVRLGLKAVADAAVKRYIMEVDERSSTA